MILAIDVGNTETTLGLFDGDAMQAHWRIVTEAARTPDEFGLQLRALIHSHPEAARAVRAVAIGSVVPAVTGALAEASERWLNARAIIVDARSPLPIAGSGLAPQDSRSTASPSARPSSFSRRSAHSRSLP